MAASSTASTAQSAAGSATFLEKLAQDKDDFHENRWRCIYSPERALETLGSCTKLEISILSARRLLAWTASHSFETPGKPYVKVFMDDQKVFETKPERSTEPNWAHKDSIDLTALTSMVRLQVMDQDNLFHQEDIGFVEFNLGDLPWDKDIKGWMELRFHDMLELTSEQRYARHTSMRDDQEEEHHDVRQQLLKGPGMCGVSACSRAPRVQRNAGEVLVQLRLKRTGTWLDTALALALDSPAPKHYGTRPKPKKEHLELPELNVQDIRDSITDIKMELVDGAFACTSNFIDYVLKWRSLLLSAFVSAALITTWLLPPLTWVVIPLMLAWLLVLFSSLRVRHATTIGGSNAPLSEEGLRSVASWRSTASMCRFLRRIVETDLQGKVINEQKLRACAAHCFSNGVPKVSYQQLREGLRDAKWTVSTKEELAPGALVVVSGAEGNRRGTVQKVVNGDINVKYDDGPEDSVSSFEVTPRPVAPSVPTWILPQDLNTQLRMIEVQIEGTKKSLLAPVKKLTQVLTWRSPCASGALVMLLLAVSATEATVLLGVWGNLPGVLGGRVAYAAGIVMGCVKFAVHWGAFALAVLLLVYQAPFLVGVRSVVKIMLRMLRLRRRAPGNWPFFRSDSCYLELP